MEVIRISDDVHVKVDDKTRTAILSVGKWESFVTYDRARDITADSPDVKVLRRLNEI